jgi:hypothetical protein
MMDKLFAYKYTQMDLIMDIAISVREKFYGFYHFHLNEIFCENIIHERWVNEIYFHKRFWTKYDLCWIRQI